MIVILLCCLSFASHMLQYRYWLRMSHEHYKYVTVKGIQTVKQTQNNFSVPLNFSWWFGYRSSQAEQFRNAYISCASALLWFFFKWIYQLLYLFVFTERCVFLDSKMCIFFFHGAKAAGGPRPPCYRGFAITLRHTTDGRTPLEE